MFLEPPRPASRVRARRRNYAHLGPLSPPAGAGRPAFAGRRPASAISEPVSGFFKDFRQIFRAVAAGEAGAAIITRPLILRSDAKRRISKDAPARASAPRGASPETRASGLSAARRPAPAISEPVSWFFKDLRRIFLAVAAARLGADRSKLLVPRGAALQATHLEGRSSVRVDAHRGVLRDARFAGMTGRWDLRRLAPVPMSTGRARARNFRFLPFLSKGCNFLPKRLPKISIAFKTLQKISADRDLSMGYGRVKGKSNCLSWSPETGQVAKRETRP